MPLRGTLATGIAAMLLLVAIPSADAVTIVGGAGARTWTVKARGSENMGELTLLVRNDSSHTARPAVRFISKSVGTKAQLESSTSPVRPGRIGEVQLTLSASATTDLTGTLAIALGSPKEVAVPVAPKPATPAQVAVQPEEVSVHITRDCPSFLGHFICGDSSAPTIGIAASILHSGTVPLKRLASSSTGGTATITLSEAAKEKTALPPELVPATMSVKARTHGRYSTTFALEPEAKHDGTLKVNVDVQDWWLLPFVVLILGAMCGYAARWLMGTYRDRRVLKAKLLEDRAIYKERIPSRTPGVYPLADWFGSFAEPIPAIPELADCGSDGLSEFAATWCEVDRARSSEEVEASRAKVEQLGSDLATWRKVNTALENLGAAFEAAVPKSAERENEAIPAYAETQRLITSQILSKPSEDKAPATIQAMRNQAAIISLYAAAAAAWARLDDTKKNANAALNPFTSYGTTSKVLTRTQEEADGLKATLVTDTHQIERIAAAKPLEPAASALALAQQPARAIVLVGAEAAAVEVPAARPPLPPPPPSPSDPTAIRRAIAAVDWLVFGSTLIVSAALYFLTLYVGKDFGGTSQYVEAFAAGFGGQAIVGVATIPIANSLMTVKKEK